MFLVLCTKFTTTVIFIHIVFGFIKSEINESTCLYAFCEDISWPSPEILQSHRVYGSAVALDKENNVIVLHRSTSMNKGRIETINSESSKDSMNDLLIENDVIIVLHSISGKILRTWGGGRKFAKPHGIEIAQDGSLFVTDVLLHQVFKFHFNSTSDTWNGIPVLILGEKFIPGGDTSHFCGPADVAVLPSSENFFVADGYCNSRIIKFNEFGTYLVEFQAGSANSLSPHIPFNVTHAIKVALPCLPESSTNISNSDSQPQSVAHDKSKPPLIFVADRNNARIQSFSENGTFLYEIGSENFAQSKEMLFSFDFVSQACHSNKNSANYYGTLFAVIGHLPRGKPKIFEIAVGQNKYQIIGSFPTSPESEARNESDVESPHDICSSRNGQLLYIIEAKNELVLKKFVKNKEFNKSELRKSSSSYKIFRSIELILLHLSILLLFQLFPLDLM